jgi:glyoxylase-like metal-dependent hydrolase (beta-lactamase superfamily II)
MLRIESVVVGPFEVNCWIAVADADAAIVVDPGADPDAIAHFLSQGRLRVAAYICTHGHVDHVSALAPLCRRFPAPIAMHRADAAWAFSEGNAMPPYYDPPEKPDRLERQLGEGSRFEDGGLAWEVLETPGHSRGSVCIYLPGQKTLFTGDTLFAGSAGRTDLEGGDARALGRSLKRLAALPDDVAVYPGHGPSSTIGEEKRTNFFMRSPERVCSP